MKALLIVSIVFDIIYPLLVLWGFSNKDKLKGNIKKIKRSLCARWLAKEGIVIPREGEK